jgi:hypothetical protein
MPGSLPQLPYHVAVRKQYYFRPSERGLLAWDVDRLVALSSSLPRIQVPLSELKELDANCFGDDEPPTWRSMIEHLKLIEDADLSFPIILSANGSVMDGRHRIAKAAMLGLAAIDAVRFSEDPSPDYIGRAPSELPYEDA